MDLSVPSETAQHASRFLPSISTNGVVRGAPSACRDLGLWVDIVYHPHFVNFSTVASFVAAALSKHSALWLLDSATATLASQPLASSRQ